MGKIRSLSKDFILSILSVIISTGTLQFFVYPILAKQLGDNEYGFMLTIIGIINVFVVAFGDNLCNVRLLVNEEYNKKNITGDFQLLVLIMTVVASLLIYIIGAWSGYNVKYCVGVVAIVATNILKNYYLVAFRLIINYTKYLLLNIFVSIGYIIAISLYMHIAFFWPMVYILSNVIGLIYIFTSSNIMREPINKTPLFKKTLRKTIALVGSSFLSNLTSYLDRFLIFPILGASAVALFTTATFFSKLFFLVCTAMTGVVLSYLISNRKLLTRRIYTLVNIILGCCCSIIPVLSLTIGKVMTNYLYPTLFFQSEDYILLGSIGVAINVISSFSSMVVLAYAPSKWQIILAILRCLIYLAIGWMFTSIWGLYGMCCAVIIVNTVLWLLMYVIGLDYLEV